MIMRRQPFLVTLAVVVELGELKLMRVELRASHQSSEQSQQSLLPDPRGQRITWLCPVYCSSFLKVHWS